MKKLLQWLTGSNSAVSPRGPSRPRGFRPSVERLEDRQVPTVTYHYGALLPHVEVETLFLGSNWYSNPTLYQQTGYLDGFLASITNSSYMDMLTQAGYGVGRGQFLDGKIELASLSRVIDDTFIQAQLQSYIDAGYLQSPDSNRLYFVYVEPGVVVTAGSANSANDFLGYHYSWLGHNRAGYMANINYAVIPYAGAPNAVIGSLPNPLDGMTEVSSHELAEAVTDPQPSGIKGWYDDSLNGEIGDIVNQKYVYWNGYVVQKEAGQNDQPLTPQGTLIAAGQNISVIAGQAFSGVVATLTEGDVLSSNNSYQAEIDWGDGQVSMGYVNGYGTFGAFGTHTYNQTGSFVIKVLVADSNGTSAAANGTATVQAPPITAWGEAVTATAGQAFTTTVAAFSDPDPGTIPANYTATIQWGDGQVTNGQVQETAAGQFVIVGSHTYAQAGSYTVTVQINDVDGTGVFVSTAANVAVSLSADERFVNQLYKDFLGRSGSRDELDGWAAALPAVGHGGVSNGIARSEEALKRVIGSMYQQFLGRAADASGEADWLRLLQAGGTEEQLMEGLLASNEFALHANTLFGSGDTNANYISGLYDLILGRSASAQEVGGWLRSLPSMGRAGLAAFFVTCAEFRSDAVRTYYGNGNQVAEPFFPDLLDRVNRPADGEVSPWVTSGLDLLSIELSLAASAEYYNQGGA